MTFKWEWIRVILVLVLLCPVAGAETSSNELNFPAMTPAKRPGLLDFLVNLPEDWKHWAGQVVAPENTETVLALTALTGFTILTDYETWQGFAKLHEEDKFIRNMNRQAEFAGQGVSQFALAGLFLAAGIVDSDNRALRTGSQIMEVIIGTGMVIQLGKHVTGRQSPFKSSSRTGDWVLFPDQVNYNRNVQAHDAMPSGHIATAQATVSVIVENYPEKKWIPYVGYPLVAWVGMGLVGTSIHWLSDIPFGIAIGHSMAKSVTRGNYKKSETPSASYWPEIQPMWHIDGAPLFGLKWELL